MSGLISHLSDVKPKGLSLVCEALSFLPPAPTHAVLTATSGQLAVPQTLQAPLGLGPLLWLFLLLECSSSR